MAVTNQVVTIGTSEVQVVYPSVDTQRILFENQAPSSSLGDYSRDGYSYSVSRQLTIANGGTALFSFTTGSDGAQFDFWDFEADDSSIRAELVEGATITKTGTAIPGYNLNRNYSDAHDAVLEGATAMVGGTVILSEYIGASKQSAGGAISNKVITLEPNTEYGFRFIDVGGKGPNLHIQIIWIEKYNGLNDVWLGGTVGSGIRLRGGEKVELTFYQGESLTAISSAPNNKLALLKRD